MVIVGLRLNTYHVTNNTDNRNSSSRITPLVHRDLCTHEPYYQKDPGRGSSTSSDPVATTVIWYTG